jgi:acetolactate decarboxylase
METSTYPRLVGLVAVALAACTGKQSEPDLMPASRVMAAPRVTLTTYGSLSDVMKEGKTGPAVWLRKMGDDPSLVGIGALSGLRGEVAVLDGNVWLGYSTNATSPHGRALSGTDETAAFLTVASVPEWQTFTLATRVHGADLALRLEKLAGDAGLDARLAIPVVVTGRFENLRYYVADGRGLISGRPILEKELAQTSSRTAHANAKGVLVGFFSTGAHPAMLHPGVRHHLHVVLPEKTEIGHVERVDLEVGTTVRLPLPAR